MNRERRLTGANGYSRELGFQPLDFLNRRLTTSGRARWLDLCCGSGTALIEAAHIVRDEGRPSAIEIVGVDLVGMFRRSEPDVNGLRLIECSLTKWRPDGSFDLVTCVHGLHYIGDKLGLVGRAISWLTPDGLFVANLDLKNLKLRDGRPGGRAIGAVLRQAGLEYDRRKKLLVCRAAKQLQSPCRYLGADDQAGPNYTGQPAVDSYYQV